MLFLIKMVKISTRTSRQINIIFYKSNEFLHQTCCCINSDTEEI
jgi:hypothetical protein